MVKGIVEGALRAYAIIDKSVFYPGDEGLEFFSSKDGMFSAYDFVTSKVLSGRLTMLNTYDVFKGKVKGQYEPITLEKLIELGFIKSTNYKDAFCFFYGRNHDFQDVLEEINEIHNENLFRVTARGDFRIKLKPSDGHGQSVFDFSKLIPVGLRPMFPQGI